MNVVVVGAGPAGTRAAEVLVGGGLRPVVVDEAPSNGGRIYQRPPAGFTRPPEKLYGFEAGKARRLHADFAAMADRIDHRPGHLVWNIRPGAIDLVRDGVFSTLPWDRVILATGAMDRVIPLPGWTLPGVTTLGGSQVALKHQGVGIGRRVAFVGSGPLLLLVAHQYASAGAEVALVLETTPFSTMAAATPGLLADPITTAKGGWYLGRLLARGIPVVFGATPVAIEGGTRPTGLRWTDRGGHERSTACDAVAIGWGLKPETQLADLAGVPLVWDETQRGWLPERGADGRTPLGTVYLAGDGARIGGADVAEAAGARAAWALLEDAGRTVDARAVAALEARLAKAARFRRALDRAYPFPSALAASVGDDTVLCRCERITAGELRAAAREEVRVAAPEINRAKAFTRIGMGRCQGRVCGPPATEILAAALACPAREVGRLRGQAPVKPIPMPGVAAPTEVEA